MNACGSGSPSLGLHSMPILPSPPSLTLLTRYVPASTGVQGKRLTSQRGVVPSHCGGVLVVLASWRAPCAPSVGFGPDILILLQMARQFAVQRARTLVFLCAWRNGFVRRVAATLHFHPLTERRHG